MTRRPHVSDHALLRYLERVVGIDVEGHRRRVEARVAEAVSLGASGLISGGFRYAISDFLVVTVMPASSDPRLLRPGAPDDEQDEDEHHVR